MSYDMELLVEKFQDENKIRTEGRKGVEGLCKLSRALGYKDTQYFGQLTSDACIGDLIEMLEDNPGVIEAMWEWVASSRCSEFKEKLSEVVDSNEEDEEVE
jgi:hypothetical protein